MRAIPQKERPGVELNTNNVIKLKRKRIKKINPLWIIAGLLAAILIAVLVILVRGGAEGIAETGSVTVDVDYNAVIVRQEKVITSEAFDLADYFAEEGAWVEPDTKIMQIYRRGYSEEQAAALMRKHAEIYDEQLALLGETRDKTIRGYNESIALLEENIAEELMAGNSAEVRRQEAELLDALASRTDYLRENLQETETLRALYSQADALAEVVETQRHVLYSQESGFVSFYFDDYENALNADKLSILTSDLVSSVIKGKGGAAWTTASDTSAYRLVGGDEWYCVFLTGADEALRCVGGRSYSIAAKGHGTYTAVALEPIVSGKKVVNILKVEGAPTEFLNTRRIELTVRFDASDICVSKQAIQFENGVPYIELLLSDGKYCIFVNVLSADDKRAVINVREDQDMPIAVGVRYWIP